MLVDVNVSFSDDDASAWKAFTDDDLLGGRSSSLLGRYKLIADVSNSRNDIITKKVRCTFY